MATCVLLPEIHPAVMVYGTPGNKLAVVLPDAGNELYVPVHPPVTLFKVVVAMATLLNELIAQLPPSPVVQ